MTFEELNQIVAANAVAIDRLVSNQETHERNLSRLEAALATHDANLSRLEGMVEAHDGRLTRIEEGIEKLVATVAATERQWQAYLSTLRKI